MNLKIERTINCLAISLTQIHTIQGMFSPQLLNYVNLTIFYIKILVICDRAKFNVLECYLLPMLPW